MNMMLRKFRFPSVALHSMMKQVSDGPGLASARELRMPAASVGLFSSQRERFAALAKFKSSICKILIATDVAAR